MSRTSRYRRSGERIPERSGAWGRLLPVGRIRGRTYPDAGDAVVEISPACLRLASPTDSLRGYGAAVAWLFGIAMAVAAIVFVTRFDATGRGYARDFFVFSSLLIALAVIGLTAGYKMTFDPVAETAIISRRLRRIYAWTKRTGWVFIDYDRAIAIVRKRRLTTTTGSTTLYPLGVVELWPDERRARIGIALTSPFASPQPAAELWDFVRCYMEEEPEKVTPVRLTPDHRVNAYAWMDRELYADAVDRQHHLTGFGGVAFWFFASMFYGGNWLEYWIRNHAPRPALPAELAEALKWEGENPYRIIPPTREEQLAAEGRLPHLKKRWRIVSFFGLLFWVVLPLLFFSVFLFGG